MKVLLLQNIWSGHTATNSFILVISVDFFWLNDSKCYPEMQLCRDTSLAGSFFIEFMYEDSSDGTFHLKTEGRRMAYTDSLYCDLGGIFKDHLTSTKRCSMTCIKIKSLSLTGKSNFHAKLYTIQEIHFLLSQYFKRQPS